MGFGMIGGTRSRTAFSWELGCSAAGVSWRPFGGGAIMPGKAFVLVGVLLGLVCGPPPGSPGQEKGKPAVSREREALMTIKLQGKQFYYSSTTWEVLPAPESSKGALCVT